MVKVGTYQVHLDMAIKSKNAIIALGLFDGSLQRIKAFCAILNLQWSSVEIEGKSMLNRDKMNIYIAPVIKGKEKFYHAVLINSELQKNFLVTTIEQAGASFYDWLMTNFNLPLLQWWGEALLEEALETGRIAPPESHIIYGPDSCVSGREFAGMRLDEIIVYETGGYSEDDLIEAIEGLFEKGRIWISRQPQYPLEAKSVDDYFSRYGPTLIDTMKKIIHPLAPLDGTCNSLVLRNKKLFPQQCAMVNGVLSLLKRARCAFLIEGMGVGKTIQAASICEGYFVERYLAMHRKETLYDVYSDYDKIAYRNIIMCPGHLTEKWAKEITEEIPFAKATIIHELSQLIELSKQGPDRTHREFHIMSKEVAKLSYLSRPVPTRMKYNRPIRIKKVQDMQ